MKRYFVAIALVASACGQTPAANNGTSAGAGASAGAGSSAGLGSSAGAGSSAGSSSGTGGSSGASAGDGSSAGSSVGDGSSSGTSSGGGSSSGTGSSSGLGGGCPAVSGGMFYVDADGGALETASPAPTGAQTPVSCRFKTLRSALAVAGASGSAAIVTATGAASGTMSFLDEIAGVSPTALAVPGNVSLTTDGDGTYSIVLNDDGGNTGTPAPTLTTLLTVATGASISHFHITETNAAAGSTMVSVGDVAGTVTLTDFEVEQSPYIAIEVVHGTLVATSINAHDNGYHGIYVDQTATGLTLADSELKDNSPTSGGSGLTVEAGTIVINNTTFDHNWDGIHFASGEMTINAGTVVKNSKSTGLIAAVDFDYSLHNLAANTRKLHIIGTSGAAVRFLDNTFAGLRIGGYKSSLDGVAGAPGDDPCDFDATHLDVEHTAPLSTNIGLALWNGSIYDHTSAPPPRTATVTASTFVGNATNLVIGRSYATGATPQPTVISDCTFDGGINGIALQPWQNSTGESYSVKLSGTNEVENASGAGVLWGTVYFAGLALDMTGMSIHSNGSNGIHFDGYAPPTFTFQSNRIYSNTGDQVAFTKNAAYTTTFNWDVSGAAGCTAANFFGCLGASNKSMAVGTGIAVNAYANSWPDYDPTGYIGLTGTAAVNTGYSSTPGSNLTCDRITACGP